ncbi:hypothetical protein CA13_42790 [Planctomycetes bacterium CA13]|uniref:Uncharacterized protein n=2 Tax=Novipirellula herctigrandis TaxID=2527986 RepID=A0A5C5Z6Y7_9BACT|nr:hypothetical protein CA13_42790 [Planctomycetes bacterium CA13]
MVAHVQPVYQYSVDEADIIIRVNDWWIAFAKENNAAVLDEPSVVGHAVWDFIADEPTRMLYKEIHEQVRKSGIPITVPFRCDSPTLKRFMQLTIGKNPRGQLLYESSLIRAVPQARCAVLDSQQKRSNAFLTMCSFCKRSLVEPSGWLEMENISLKLRQYERQTVPELRYTVCPVCVNQLRVSKQ